MAEKPILYSAIRSPPCRAVLLTAAAIGLELDVRDVFQHMSEIGRLNPCMTVPILDDNGLIVNDSHVINTYLVDKYASDDKLYPKDPHKRREVDTLLYFDGCHIFSRGRLMFEKILKHGGVEIEEFSIQIMQETYDLLENRLGDSPYLSGDQLTIADLHAIATVTSTIMSAPLDDEKHKRVKAWVNRLSQLPYFAKINQPGLDAFKADVEAIIENNLKAKVQ